MKKWKCPKCPHTNPVWKNECWFCGFKVIDPRAEEFAND